MRHVPTGPRRGFSLLEVLAALIILLVGVLGVLALFPIALRTSKSSFEDTMAAMIAENVREAIVVSLRRAPPLAVAEDNTTVTEGTRYFQFFCEGVPTAFDGTASAAPTPAKSMPGNIPSFLVIPSFTNLTTHNVFYYPPRSFTNDWFTTSSTPGGTVPLSSAWNAALANNVPELAGTTRTSDPYGQYSFNLVLRPSQTPHIERLLEITIRIYRNYVDAASRPLQVFPTLIAYN